MIYTQNELDISSKSYTNKDFESIYLEILDYAEKLSKRFSPKDSNEADPYIVLLKLLAFVGDKINYNIDKNILERFILSCTQQTSMNQLTDMLGYSPKYYQSAKTTVAFRYLFADKDIQNDPKGYIKIPAHSILKDYNSTIQYITLDDAFLYYKTGVSDFVDAIQGVLKTFTAYGSSIILLENLDTNNRLYFPERMVAENGVFITNSIFSNNWTAVDNLYTAEYNSGVYKFGYDAVLDLPYIQFPEWINNVIGDGLTIQYIVTNGAQGNISSNSLSSVTRVNVDTSSETAKISDADIGINHPYAAVSGADPESLNEAYVGYKKTVGVFNTLVTCRDYAKAIYDLLDSYDEPFVSNCIVTDRRSDLNYSSNTLTLINGIAQTVNVKIPETSETTDPKTCRYISPYDLCLYLFEPFFDIQGLDRDRKIEKFNNSFDLSNYGTDFAEIVNQLELNTSNISHDYKQFKIGDIVSVENQFEIIATISTKTKVTEVEAQDIILKVESELIRNFNARNLQFGQDLPFDTVLEVIENADSRIKKVSLQDFAEIPHIRYITTVTDPKNNSALDTSYTTKLIALEDADGNLQTDNPYFKVIIAKNILEGKISVYKYDEDFEYAIFQKDCQKRGNISYLTSKWYLDYTDTGTVFTDAGYTLKENEVIQFISPHMTVEKIYPYGIEYAFHRHQAPQEDGSPYTLCSSPIPKNSIYQLQTGDVLVLKFDESEGQTRYVRFEGGSFIYTTFDLYDTEYMKTGLKKTPLHDKDTDFQEDIKNRYPKDVFPFYFYLIDSSDELHHLTADIETLDSGRYCYWILNNSDNKFNWDRVIPNGSDETITCTYMLQDGEYFIFSDINFSNQIYYGSGSTLTVTGHKNFIESNFERSIYNKINISDINTLGLASLRNVFRYIEFTSINQLEAIQNDLVTMIAGDNIRIDKEGLSLDPSFTLFANDNQTALKDAISANNYSDINDKILPDINGFSQVNFTDRLILKSASDADLLLENRSLLMDPKYMWQGRTVLDLNISSKKEQELISNQYLFDVKADGGITSINDIIYLRTPVADSSACEYLKANHSIQKSGGSKINVQYFDLESNDIKPAILLRYTKDMDTIRKIKYTEDVLSTLDLDGDITYGSTYKFTQNMKVTKATDGSYQAYLSEPYYFYISANTPGTEELSGKVIIKLNDIDPITTRSGALIKGKLSDIDANSKILATLDTATKKRWELDVTGVTADGSQIIWYPNPEQFENCEITIPDVYLTSADEDIEELPINFTLQVSDNLKITLYDPTIADDDSATITLYSSNGSESERDIADYKTKLIGIQLSSISYGEKLTITAFDKDSKVINGIRQFNSKEVYSKDEAISSEASAFKSSLEFTAAGLYIIELTANVHHLKAIKTPRVQSLAKIAVSDVKYIRDTNPALDILSDTTNIVEFIAQTYPEQFEKFYIIGEADPVKRIDLPKGVSMSSATAFYDVNNVANICTIPKITFSKDIRDSGIQVARSSIKR